MEKNEKEGVNLAEIIKTPEKHTDSKISNLTSRHEGIIALVATGMSYTEVALVLDVSPTTVSNIVKSELGQKRLADKTAEIQAAITSAHINIAVQAQEVWLENETKAAQRIATIMESGSDANSLRAAQIILDQSEKYKKEINPDDTPAKRHAQAIEDAFEEVLAEDRVIN